MRIPRGSVIIELYDLGFEETYLFFKQLFDLNINSIDIVVYPNYFYGRKKSVTSIYQYIAGFYSVILHNNTDVLEKILHYFNTNYYIVERDAWIDTKKLNLEKFIKTLDQLIAYVKECSSRVFEFENIVVSINCLNKICSDILIIDYVNAPLNWISQKNIVRIEESLLKEIMNKRPVEYILCCNYCENEYTPLLVYKPTGSKKVVKYIFPIYSGDVEEIRKYVFWSLVDLMLK